MGIPAIFSWSGGKDSSYALHKVMQEGVYEIRYLLATFNGQFKRLSMHGVREELIELQSERIGIPLKKVYVYETDNASYERQMGALLEEVRSEGIHQVIFGDIFLEDLRKYREEKMEQVGMSCVFPLWKKDTSDLVNAFVEEGFKTITCCINDGYLDASWCGRLIDKSFIKELPAGVDPCGENGEFHSFCYDGPIFSKPIEVKTGELIYRALEVKMVEQSESKDLSQAESSSASANQPANPSQPHPFPIKASPTKGFWYCELDSPDL
jgi:uncharacterized protein (TIGR00290 family)